MKQLMLLFSLIGLTACTTQSQQTRYYSLNLQQPEVVDVSQTNKVRVIIHSVELAEFLSQDKLVMQLGGHELYFAEYHRWAEPLEKEVTQLIRQTLERKNRHFEFIQFSTLLKQKSALQLHIKIDKFHATDQSEVVLSGDYWILNHDKTIKVKNTFHITDNLTKDGYLHAVIKLKQAVIILSQQINQSLVNIEGQY